MTTPQENNKPADPASSVETDADTTGSVSPQTADALAGLADSDLEPADRRKLLGRAVTGLGKSAGRAFRGPRAAANWGADLVIAAVPHLAIRDLDTLRRHYDGKSGEDLADAIIRNASRTTAGIGAAGGSVAAVEWTAPPALLSTPVLLTVETAAVVAVEVKMLAELHEVYGVPVQGSASERASALLTAWARRRGVTLLQAGRGFSTVLGAGLRKELRDRLLRRMGRNLTTLGPLLTGAAIGAELNRRATRKLGDEVREDLRKQARKALR
ncbi:hypothetical protein [Cryptosporangium phraense]|uniref:hypothetical protein n=1 Tax=Cryptosporangium phraense TaxID=2593070 RepID=UPI00197A9E06|nr:hypothetical protein [Cryptosporangium phraense]